MPTPSRRTLRIAHHEAGHAVACYRLGFRVLGIAANRQGGFVDYAKPPHLRAEALADAALVVSFAGPQAECRFTGRRDWRSFTDATEALAQRPLNFGITAKRPDLPVRLPRETLDGGDARYAAIAAELAWIDPAARIHHWHMAQSEAACLVVDHWQAITTLARHLARAGRMSGAEFSGWTLQEGNRGSFQMKKLAGSKRASVFLHAPLQNHNAHLPA